MQNRLFIAEMTFLCLAATFASCKPSDTAPAEKTHAYDLRGVIDSMPTPDSPHVLVIHHEATKDMDSMSMPFLIDPALSLNGLAKGDEIAFRYEIDLKTGQVLVTKLEKLPSDTPLNIPAASTSPAATMSATMPGM